jgi:diphthamide biosynthesis protein 7
MHGGFHVVRVGSDDLSVVSALDTAGELAYGAAWHQGATSERGLVASCTFYDHNLQLWRQGA